MKQRELNILPIRFKFMYNDLTLFYKILNSLLPISLPEYMTVAEADHVRYTRRTAGIVEHTDTSTICCSITPNCDSFRNSYFYRTMGIWNKLPVSIRQSNSILAFKSLLVRFFWSADTSWPD